MSKDDIEIISSDPLWVMDIYRDEDATKIRFNTKEHPDLSADEFAKKVITILSESGLLNSLIKKEAEAMLQKGSGWHWIHIKDSLPENGKDVLTLKRYLIENDDWTDLLCSIDCGWYTNIGTINEFEWNSNGKVIYWTSIPPIP